MLTTKRILIEIDLRCDVVIAMEGFKAKDEPSFEYATSETPSSLE